MKIRRRDLQSTHIDNFDRQICNLSSQRLMRTLTLEDVRLNNGQVEICRGLTCAIKDLKIRKNQFIELS